MALGSETAHFAQLTKSQQEGTKETKEETRPDESLIGSSLRSLGSLGVREMPPGWSDSGPSDPGDPTAK